MIEKKKRKTDQVNENKIRATPRSNVRKWNVHVIWMIANNDFYKRIWKQTDLTRGTFGLFTFILFPLAKVTGGTRDGSTTLVTKTVASR